MEQLKAYGEYLEDKIEPLSDISKVDIRGVQEKEVKIDVNVHKMEAVELSFQDVENAIAFENMSVSGGDILVDELNRTVRVTGEFTSIEEINNVIVKREKFDIVYLKDIANVSFEFEERESYAREFQKPVVMLDVVKRVGANLIHTSEAINVIIEEARAREFPKNLQISITNDQSDMTRSQVNNLENSIISGVILVVIVLLFFLGLRNAMLVGIAIPLSMFTAFIILNSLGVTLNIMVLFSLILALGMLVDNGIVVVENVYRLMDEGFPPIMAAKKGAGEVALPIITSTATTLAAFISLAFWPGIMGEFMKWLPVTLMIVLGSSLFVALVINPVLTAVWMRPGTENLQKSKTTRTALLILGVSVIFYIVGTYTVANLLLALGFVILINSYILNPAAGFFQARIIPGLDRRYETFLNFAISGSKPLAFFIGTIGLLVLSIILLIIFTPKVEFFPVNEPKYVNVFIQKPIGTDIEATNEATREVEKVIAEMLQEYNDTTNVQGDRKIKNYLVSSLIAQVGEGTSDPKQGMSFGNTPHLGRVQVSFVEFKDRRGISTQAVLEDIRETVRYKYPGVQITADKDPVGPPQGKAINIEVVGEDYDSLIVLADRMKSFINARNIPGIEELNLDVELGKPELIIEIDRAKARRLNLASGQIGSAIRTAVFGKEVSKYKEGEDDYPIVVRFDKNFRNNIETLMNQRITFRDQTNGKISQVPVSSVANARKTTTYSAVKRKNLKRVVTINSNVEVGYNPTETVNNIRMTLQDFDIPTDYEYQFTGEQKEQAKELSFLSKALMIAVFLIFLIMVSQFISASTPFIIIAFVVFSLIGVLLGLVIFQMDFIVIMTMIGIISLAGVVVNNAIVLLDYTNLLMKRRRMVMAEETGGNADEISLNIEEIKDCIVEGGKTRLRPVLLTAVTTILGLFPLAIGLNINFFTLFSEFDPQFFIGGDNVMFWGPIAWTVIFGLTFATFLTLVIVPIMYYLVNLARVRLSGISKSKVGR